MKFSNIQFVKSSLLAVSIALVSPSVLASGVDSFGGGASGTQQLYAEGKAVYSQKLACKGCALANKKLTKDVAMMVLSDSNTTKMLSMEEKQALEVYLTKRFNLKN